MNSSNCKRVFGFYSLCVANVEFAELPDKLRRQLPEYPIPAALIAKLAVDVRIKSQGLGAKLLIEALQRVVTASKQLSGKPVLVDAVDVEARDFYWCFGFIALPEQDFKLFLQLETIC